MPSVDVTKEGSRSGSVKKKGKAWILKATLTATLSITFAVTLTWQTIITHQMRTEIQQTMSSYAAPQAVLAYIIPVEQVPDTTTEDPLDLIPLVLDPIPILPMDRFQPTAEDSMVVRQLRETIKIPLWPGASFQANPSKKVKRNGH